MRGDMSRARTPQSLKIIVATLLLLLAVRVVTMALYPLGSTTEPRYAEIARKMLETGNWVTPWFDHGVPFWGKPPLSFWGSAATMAVFGVNEFGARLAPFLAALGTVACFWFWRPAPQRRPDEPWAAALVFFSSLIGFIASSAVMTDMFMVLGTTLSMLGFWRAVNDQSGHSPWRWVFFVGLGMGLLAKGPVATVLTGLALSGWLLVCGEWRNTWRRLSWLRGLLLTAAIASPWYVLAEMRTPGFLRYFIVGEHFERFVVSGWAGDLYGQGHPEPRGKIWLFALAGFAPWVLVLPLVPWALRRTGVRHSLSEAAPRGEWVYLLSWMLAPLVFFTAARNILEAYVLPGLPAFALLFVLCWQAATSARPALRWVWLLGLVPPLLFGGWVLTSKEPQLRSHKALLAHWQPGVPLTYLGARPLSANFYSFGQARNATTPQEAHEQLLKPGPQMVAIQEAWRQSLNADDLVGWQVVAEHAGYTLMVRPR